MKNIIFDLILSVCVLFLAIVFLVKAQCDCKCDCECNSIEVKNEPFDWSKQTSIELGLHGSSHSVMILDWVLSETEDSIIYRKLLHFFEFAEEKRINFNHMEYDLNEKRILIEDLNVLDYIKKDEWK